jgi:long-chain acyl-CoA synthetase
LETERIWLQKTYPAGVPADIDVNQYTSVVDDGRELQKFAEKSAYHFMGKDISYPNRQLSQAFGAYLQGLGWPRATGSL